MDITKGLIELLAVVGAGTLIMSAIVIFLFRKEFKRWLLRPKYLDWCYEEKKEIRFLFINEDADVEQLNYSKLKSYQSSAYKMIGDDRVKTDASHFFFCYEKDVEKIKEWTKKDGHRVIKEIKENEDEASFKKTLIFA